MHRRYRDPAVGCVFTPISCDDQDLCTEDSCDPVTGCIFTPISCDDGDACTDDSCDPAVGCVFTPIACDDDSACTEDACDPATGCVFTPIPCDDGDACTEDACDPETGCVFTPITCDDGDPNTEDFCDSETGECRHALYHPADLNQDWRIVIGEAIGYLAGWQQGTNPIGYAIRGAYIWQNGEHYTYDEAVSPPLCWVLAQGS